MIAYCVSIRFPLLRLWKLQAASRPVSPRWNDTGMVGAQCHRSPHTACRKDHELNISLEFVVILRVDVYRFDANVFFKKTLNSYHTCLCLVGVAGQGVAGASIYKGQVFSKMV